MKVTETIPSVLVWADIKAQSRLYDESEKDLLVSYGVAAVQAFERETGVALASRSVVVEYSYDDLLPDRRSLILPKSPVISVSHVVDGQGNEFDDTSYEIRQQGNTWYIALLPSTILNTLPFPLTIKPITVTYTAGHASIPQVLKVGLMQHVDDLYRNRGGSTNQQQYINQMGLERLYRLFSTNKVMVG